MRRTEALQGVRMMAFRSVLGRFETAELNQMEAAELLVISERTFRRWCQRYEEAAKPDCWIVVSAGVRAGGCRWIASRRSRPCIAPATAALRRGTSMTILSATTGSPGIHLDEEPSCNREAC
jgi:Helix-turn-helix domain